MASTNKTTNYDLSQYIGSDKPTYLTDYNGDMLKIDTQMKTNADNIATAISGVESATTTANQANTTANQANTTATQANTTASQANTTAGNAQSTANSALSTATSAQTTANQANTKIDELNASLNFTNIKNYTQSSTGVSTNNYSISSMTVSVATNSDGDIFKVYGTCYGTFPNPNSNGSVVIATDLRPESNITINCSGIVEYTDNGTFRAIRANSIDITTTGNLTINIARYGGTSTEIKRVILFPCLYFGKDFGDTPLPNNE